MIEIVNGVERLKAYQESLRIVHKDTIILDIHELIPTTTSLPRH